MDTSFTITQKERLVELGADDMAEMTFTDKAGRDRKFAELEKALVSEHRKNIKRLLSEKHIPDACAIQGCLERWLTDTMGFTKVLTPTIISGDMLEKMSITDENPLYNQVFRVDKNKFLRPMLAPNLYVAMRELHRITNGPVRIFISVPMGLKYRSETPLKYPALQKSSRASSMHCFVRP